MFRCERESTERVIGFKICFCKVSGNCLWKNCYANVCSYRSTSHCGVHKCLPHDPSLLVVFLVAPDPVFRAWVPSRVHCSQQFLTALRTIHLASNMARRPACSFYPDDQASFKLT
ncbi:hypothetical protein TNCV_1907151 [Trichonephila clavipes]|nr:hypothetical protein TNCV_1907151 [Trichonephila clavipes]